MYVLLLFLLFPFYVLAEILKNNKYGFCKGRSDSHDGLSM